METAVKWLTYMGFTIEEETKRHVIASHPDFNGLIAIRNSCGGTQAAVRHFSSALGDAHEEVIKVRRLFRELLDGDA